MRAGDYYLLDIIFFENLNILLNQNLGKIFIPYPACMVPAAEFLRSQDAEVYPCLV